MMSSDPRDDYVPRRYLDHFEKCADGSYIFTGREYVWTGENAERKKIIALTVVLALALFGCSLAPGFSTASAMLHGSYTVLAFVLELAAAVSVLWAVSRIITSGESIRDYIYDRSVDALPRRCIFSVVATALSCIALAVFCIVSGSYESGCTILFAAKAAELILAFFLRRETLSLRQKYIMKDKGL